LGSGKEELASLFVTGPPGVGKSEMIAQVANEEEGGFVDFRLTLCDPTDLRGIPFPDVQANVAKWLAPNALPFVGNDALPDKGILLFDDMTTAPQLVQATAYQLIIQPHMLGDAQLKPGWIIVGAGNRIGDKALVHPMPKPLANRFMHVDLDVNIDDWSDWATKAQINPVVIGFLRSPAAESSEGHLLFQFNPGKEEKAFPTPRTWAVAARLLSVNLPEKLEAEALAGTIGHGAAAQFSAFRRLFHELPDPDDILVRKDFSWSPKKIDLKYAMVVAIAQRAKPKQFDTAIMWADTLDPEFGVLLIKILGGRDKMAVIAANSFMNWAAHNKDVLL
jgi:hypothetical protein